MRDADEILDKLLSVIAEAELIPAVDPENPISIEELCGYNDLVGKAKALMWVLEVERTKDEWM